MTNEPSVDPDYEACRNLWIAVILEAIESTKKRRIHYRQSVHFLQGQWCKDICEMIDFDYQNIEEFTSSILP